MKIKAKVVSQKRWDAYYGPFENTYECPCGKNCIVVEIDCTPGYERRTVYFNGNGSCCTTYLDIIEDYNSFELVERKKS